METWEGENQGIGLQPSRATNNLSLPLADAASFVWKGESPYKRSTYRYSPLLAILLTPNVAVTKLCGKLLFCAADLVAARCVCSMVTCTP